MIEQDTVKLLRECDAGVKMGVQSIEDVQKYVRSEKLDGYLRQCRREHDKLGCEIQGGPSSNNFLNISTPVTVVFLVSPKPMISTS